MRLQLRTGKKKNFKIMFFIFILCLYYIFFLAIKYSISVMKKEMRGLGKIRDRGPWTNHHFSIIAKWIIFLRSTNKLLLKLFPKKRWFYLYTEVVSIIEWYKILKKSAFFMDHVLKNYGEYLDSVLLNTQLIVVLFNRGL